MPTENSPLPAAAAQLPPNLPEWDPRWSRLVTVGEHTFHVLDTADALRDIGAEPAGTIVAVHGNPTWSYMWRRLAQASIDLAQAGGTAWRIIAPDHLDMGYSERVAHPVPTPHGTGYFRLADRINQLDALISELVDDSLPLVTLGHDWGGVISLGWAARNTDRISAAMSLNTAVHQPEDASIPAPLRAALAGPLLAGSTVYTDAFIRTTLRLSKDISDRRGKKPTKTGGTGPTWTATSCTRCPMSTSTRSRRPRRSPWTGFRRPTPSWAMWAPPLCRSHLPAKSSRSSPVTVFWQWAWAQASTRP